LIGNAGGGVYVDESPGTDINTCILRENGSIEVLGWPSNPYVYYTNISGGWSGIGNIDEDPLFVNPEYNDYRLQWRSPCIDSGDPGSQYNDPDGTRADMGAFYFDQSKPVRILLSPHAIPYLIEETGGTIDFTINVTNISATPQTITAWCDLTLPDSIIICPLIGPVTFTIGPQTTIERVRTQTVPGYLAMGVYDYNAYAVAGTDTSKDSFMFGKVGSITDGRYDSWGNCGEPLDSPDDLVTHQSQPHEFTLHQNHPNPFNPTTTIRFDLPVASIVSLDIFDINGRNVGGGLASIRQYPPGSHAIPFDGSGLPSGVYIYHLQAGNFTASGKMVLLK
jgi:hypothetical protein